MNSKLKIRLCIEAIPHWIWICERATNRTQNDCIDIGQLTMESLTSVCLIWEDNITDFLIPTQIILAFLP